MLPEPVPGSCKLHVNKVLNPGCVPALSDVVDEAVADAQAYEHTYPDLVPDVTEVYVQRPYLWDPETETIVRGDPELFFDTWAQNLGTVNVDLQSEDVTNVENPPVSQCVAWEPDGVCRERQPVGGFIAHPAHGHIHFEGFAAYELRRLTASGTPDYSAGGLVAVSDKVSFCLVDSWQIDPAAFPVPTYNTCTGTREGITAGWADVYTADLVGQQFDIAGVTDGRYAVIVRMNTGGNLFEASYANNTLVAVVELTDTTAETPNATIVDKQWSAS